MQVAKINTGLSFGRALRENEIEEFKSTLKEGKQVAGQTGHSVFIMPSTSLPQAAAKNTGVGHYTSKEALDYIDYMKNYLDFNVVEDLPSGQFYGLHYNGSSFALGDQNINPELLTTDEYSSILKQEEFDGIVKANNGETKDTLANFPNISAKDGAQNTALHKAHERFKALDENSELKQKYNKFVENNKAWLEFAREDEADKDFFKFKQFLADEHLAKANKNLHDRGLKVCGDVALNFTKDEVAAFPNAFKKDHYMGAPSWKMDSLDFDKILDDSSDANKLLKMKVQLAAKRYDMLRMDAGWNYVTPVVTPKNETKVLDNNRVPLQTKLVEKIEQWVKEVKGEDFDVKKNIMYEFEAGLDEFGAFWEGKLIPAVKDRINIYQTTYMNDGWGSNEAFHNCGWTADELCVGVGNHDPQPLRQIANGVPDTINGNAVHKNASIGPLARILKLDAEKLNDPVEFAKAKWAEPMTGKNNHFFFMDVFGREERFNLHSCETGSKNYGFNFKVPFDFKKSFHKALEDGFGFNIMDSLEKVFKAKGFDQSHPELFAKISKFSAILAEKEVTESATEKAVEKAAENTATNTAKTVEKATEQASETGTKAVVKAGKSYKPLWYALGALAVAGGAYAVIKNRHPKAAHKENTKPQNEPKLTA